MLKKFICSFDRLVRLFRIKRSPWAVGMLQTLPVLQDNSNVGELCT